MMKHSVRKLVLFLCLLCSIFVFQACGIRNVVYYTDTSKLVVTSVDYAPVSGLICFDIDLANSNVKEYNLNDISHVRDIDCVVWIGGHTFADIKDGCTVITSVEGLEPATAYIVDVADADNKIPVIFNSTGVQVGTDFKSTNIHLQVEYDNLDYDRTYDVYFNGFIGLVNKDGILCAVGNLGYKSSYGRMYETFSTHHNWTSAISTKDSNKFIAKCTSIGHDNCYLDLPTITVTVDPVYVGKKPIVHLGTEAERLNWEAFDLTLPSTYTLYDSDNEFVSDSKPTVAGNYVIEIPCGSSKMMFNVQALPFTGISLQTSGSLGYEIYVDSEDSTIGEVKAAISNVSGIDVKHISVSYNMLEYDDDATLSGIGIRDGDIIDVTTTSHEDGVAYCDAGKICSICEKEYSAKELSLHKYVEVRNKVEPSCTTEGYEGDTYCKHCGIRVKRGKSIEKTEHNKVKSGKYVKVQATCISQGECYYECSSCYAKLDETYKTAVSATHTLKDNIIPATTSADGKVENKCKICNKVVSTEAIPQAYVRVNKTVAYNKGKAVKATVNVTDKMGKKIPAQYYTVSYSKNKKLGKASVKVTFTDKYTGILKDTFVITNKKEIPAKVSVKKLTAGKKAFTVTWKAIGKTCTGYEIQYSSDKNFLSKDTKTVKVTKVKTTSKEIKKLKAKQVYYVRLRAVNKDDRNNMVTSDWSKSKKITTK